MSPTLPLAEFIPDVEIIRARLERVDAEADLLRRLLRLALRRKFEAERLAREEAVQAGGKVGA
jgi:hypothetical protein